MGHIGNHVSGLYPFRSVRQVTNGGVQALGQTGGGGDVGLVKVVVGISVRDSPPLAITIDYCVLLTNARLGSAAT